MPDLAFVPGDGNPVTPLERRVIATLAGQGLTVATAESCTAGLIAARLAEVPGSSRVLDRGWIVYANQGKCDELGVSPRVLEQHGAVSRAVVEAMALGALHKSRVDRAVAAAGSAGPGGGAPGKPVGTVWLAVAEEPSPVRCFKLQLSGQRNANRWIASQWGLRLLLDPQGAGSVGP